MLSVIVPIYKSDIDVVTEYSITKLFNVLSTKNNRGSVLPVAAKQNHPSGKPEQAVRKCSDSELNQGHVDFQSTALPTELSEHILFHEIGGPPGA